MKAQRLKQMRSEFKKVSAILDQAPYIDSTRTISKDEFKLRQKKVWEALDQSGYDAGFVFSNEHYNGDVPYLGGNTNITIEQVAGVIGPNGFHIIAGLEGGYTVEQLAPRSGAPVHKVELLQLAGEDYPIEAERPDEVFTTACGKTPKLIALLTPKDVVPVKIYEFITNYFGPQSLQDATVLYGKIKYEKSTAELALTKDAAVIGDTAMRAMLAVLKPGMLETQVAAWGNYVMKEMGSEELGFDVMVNTNTSARSIIGKALNRMIVAGDMVHLGVSTKREGLTACVRRCVVALEPGQSMPPEHQFWLDLINEAYQVGHKQFIQTARENLPAYTIEKAIVNYLADRSFDISKVIGKPIDLPRQKPYSCVHNAGYTECLEFYGAITLASQEPLGEQIVNMLDVALRGIGNWWDEVVIPGLDYVVVENTFGKTGSKAECFNSLPIDCQHLVGSGI